MKYKDFPKENIIKDKYGFEFIGNSIMIGNKEQGCLICGERTPYIEVFIESHFCSEECVHKFYDYCNSMIEG